MITVDIIRNSNNELAGFSFSGHAEYADSGKDIVCSAISALVINCINSIELFTDDKDKMNIFQSEEEGVIRCIFSGPLTDSSKLLIDSMILGVENISKQYGGQYVRLND